MSKNVFLKIGIVVSWGLLLTACGSGLVIQNVDFSQPIETVMEADSQANVEDMRNGLVFNLSSVLDSEGINANDFAGTSVHMIRNHEGFYFLTAPGFQNVYVFSVGESEMKKENKIRVNGDRIANPAFNQRNPLVQLVDGSRTFNLTKDGIRN